MNKTAEFHEFHARRNAERAAEVRVTWRRVSDDTGGGYSGLGPDGRLVYAVSRSPKGTRNQSFEYGRVVNGESVPGGSRIGLPAAKRAAEILMARDVHTDAPQGAEGGTTMEATATLTAESMAADLDGIEAVRADKAPYARFRANGKTLGYADDRKDGFVLNVAAGAVEKAPKRFANALEGEGSRRTMHVTAKNEKGASALLEWLAKQVA